ncbi:MAG: putative lipid II flippase FtsW [Candidatus Competibacterales bacterium]|nr:putative lipid II flippase FtsW [Candidatus Competibacterales bacterium]
MLSQAARAPLTNVAEPRPDPWLLGAALLLVTLGLLMVTSASLPLAETQPFRYLIRQAVALILGVGGAAMVLTVPLERWSRASPWLLLLALVLLVLVLVPGVGREVNGSSRWLPLGPFNLQVSELAKLFALIYVASYLQRHAAEFYASMHSLLRLMFVLGTMAMLLLLEPDFGTTVVLAAAALGMMFLAGIRMGRFLLLQAVVLFGMLLLVYSSDYRWQRMTNFIDPWSVRYEDGYQLVQALIATGRGGLFGVGLGESLQKHHYLPEAHTDFLFAVLAEELGLVGVLVVLALFGVIVWRAFTIAGRAQDREHPFAANLAHGLGLLFALQALVNIGVNMGMLPTKGLTLPFLSYGGSSLVVMCLSLGLLLRCGLEANPPEDPPQPEEGAP